MISVVEKEYFDEFLINYSQSEEKKFGWSETAYAIEKLYNEKLVLFLIEKFGTGDLVYLSGEKDWRKNKADITCKNILITCIRQDRLLLFKTILSALPDLSVNNISEYVLRHSSNRSIREVKLAETRILQIIVRESKNALEYLKPLFDRGADVNLVELYSKNENIPGSPSYTLCEAVNTGNLDLINYLLQKSQKRPNPWRKGIFGKHASPLELAFVNKRLDIAETLLAYVNKFDIPENTNHQLHALEKTIHLHWAVSNNDFEAAKLLIKYGADPIAKAMCYGGIKTPYEMALLGGRIAILDLFSSVVFGQKD